MIGRISLFAGGLLALAGFAAQTQAGVPSDHLVIEGVTIVDTRDGQLTPNMDVIIAGGRIIAIDPAGRHAGGAAANVIKAHGKFLIPGYLDMHGHPLEPDSDPASSLQMMLAYGITGVRQMSGSSAMLEQRRQGHLMPTSDAPEILAMPGDLLWANVARTPELAVAMIQKQKQEGADFIKTVSVTPDVFFAALEESKRQGLPFEGHLAQGVDVVKASEAGMHAIEHDGPGDIVLISCSTEEAAIRKEMAQRPRKPPSPEILARIAPFAVAEPILAQVVMDPNLVRQLQRVIDSYSEEKCRTMASVLVANGTWMVPTLIRLRTMLFGDDPLYRNSPDLRYVSEKRRQLWESVAQQFTAEISPEAKETFRQFFALHAKLARLLDEAGVNMLAGSDYGGMWGVAGVDLHQEFDLLGEAGLSPLKILQMTTLEGARFYGREASMGTIDVGKAANLVLLEANPIASVANFHKIAAVIRNGHAYGRKDLDALKRNAEKQLSSTAGK